MSNRTGTDSRTVIYGPDGFVTHEIPPLCQHDGEQMEPIVWICPRCGEVL